MNKATTLVLARSADESSSPTEEGVRNNTHKYRPGRKKKNRLPSVDSKLTINLSVDGVQNHSYSLNSSDCYPLPLFSQICSLLAMGQTHNLSESELDTAPAKQSQAARSKRRRELECLCPLKKSQGLVC